MALGNKTTTLSIKSKGWRHNAYTSSTKPSTSANASHGPEEVFAGRTAVPIMCGLGAVDDDNWNGLLSFRVPASIRPMVAIDLATAGSRYLQTDTNQNATTPSAALVIKPLTGVSVYASYIRGLQPGSRSDLTFGAAPVTNSPTTLPPFIATQYEVGAKYQVTDGLIVNLAFFRVSRPNAVYQPANAAATAYTYTANGEQVNRGIELTAIGKVTRDLTIFSGITVMAPLIAHSQNGANDGKRAIGIPTVQGTVFAEYAVPPIEGLKLLAAAHYTGAEYVDSPNNRSIPGVFILDVGAKYDTKIADTPVTARFYIENLTGQDYWISSVFGPVVSLGMHERSVLTYQPGSRLCEQSQLRRCLPSPF